MVKKTAKTRMRLMVVLVAALAVGSSAADLRPRPIPQSGVG